MTKPEIHLGYEIGTGLPVSIPYAHVVVSGLTQRAGKTTTIASLIARSGARALAFLTKRGEIGLEGKYHVPYFTEPSANRWQYVLSLLETTLGERLRLHRSFIMKMTQGTRTLADVHANVRRQIDPSNKQRSRGFADSIYTELDSYLEIVVEQMRSRTFAARIDLVEGVNVMDLVADTTELQALVIRAAMEWIRAREDNVITVVPEAWKFVGMKGGPVKGAAAQLIREGAGIGNYVWLDSQDIAGIDPVIRKQIGVWILGCQPEVNEANRTLDHLPIPKSGKPKVEEVQRLGLGQFFVATEDGVRKVYVQPTWMTEDAARAVAMGTMKPFAKLPAPHTCGIEGCFGPGSIYHNAAFGGPPFDPGAGRHPLGESEDPSMCKEHETLQVRLNELSVAHGQAAKMIDEQAAEIAELRQIRTDAEQSLEREREANRRLRQDQGNINMVRDGLRTLLGDVDVPVSAGASVDVDALEQRITEAVLARIPSGGNGQVVADAPAVLRHRFQKEEVERLLSEISKLDKIQQRVLKLLIAIGQRVRQKDIFERLGIKGGDTQQACRVGIRNLTERGFVNVSEAHGVAASLREKIASDLAAYGASEADVDAVYAQAVHQQLAAA